MHVELVRTVTRDGLRLDGALHLPLPLGEGRGEGEFPSAQGPHPNPLPQREGTRQAALLLHGVAGNLYTSSTFEALIPRRQALGLAVLAVNTRGRDSVFGAMLGNVRTRLGAAYETVD